MLRTFSSFLAPPERERETETDRQTDRQKQRQTDRERQRQRDRERNLTKISREIIDSLIDYVYTAYFLLPSTH